MSRNISVGCRRLTIALCLMHVLGGAAAAQTPQAKGAGKTPSSGQPPFFRFSDAMFRGPSEEDDQRLEAVEISVKEEQRFGKAAVDLCLAELKRQRVRVLERGPEVEYLRGLVRTIQPSMRNAGRYKAIRVYLVDSSGTDAWSFPGGTLIFSRGLLDFVESEAALVAIVGHELSHLDHGHQLVPLRRRKLMQQTFAGGRQSFSLENFFESGTTLMRLWSRPFRPEDEAAADRDGVDWAYRAGYDPRELAEMFLKVAERDKHQPATVPAFFRTHPVHTDRCDAVLDRYHELQQADPQEQLYIGRENLRRRIPRSEQEFDE